MILCEYDTTQKVIIVSDIKTTNITIKTYGNILQFQEILKGKTPTCVFKYIKSETKLGQLIGFTEKELEKIQRQNGS